MSAIDDAQRQLSADIAVVKAQWLVSRAAWRDSVGDRFEEEYWRPLEDQAVRYLSALAALSDVLERADIGTR